MSETHIDEDGYTYTCRVDGGRDYVDSPRLAELEFALEGARRDVAGQAADYGAAVAAGRLTQHVKEVYWTALARMHGLEAAVNRELIHLADRSHAYGWVDEHGVRRSYRDSTPIAQDDPEPGQDPDSSTAGEETPDAQPAEEPGKNGEVPAAYVTVAYMSLTEYRHNIRQAVVAALADVADELESWGRAVTDCRLRTAGSDRQRQRAKGRRRQLKSDLEFLDMYIEALQADANGEGQFGR